MRHALVADPDADARKRLILWIEQHGFSTSGVDTVEAARREIKRHAADIAILSANLSDGSAFDLLPDIPVKRQPYLVLTTDDAALADGFERTGSTRIHVLRKPLDLGAISSALDETIRTIKRRDVRRARKQAKRFDLMLGNSAAMRNVYSMIAKVAPTDAPVLIIGESGTGKELVAHEIHQRSPRHDKRFLAVNCGAIPSNLIESELFGHEKGAYTGADKLRRGVFERATEGTLFLDEVAEMSPELQVKLLRVLEYQTLRRVGGEREIPVDVRVIAATNRDPDEAVREHQLRPDLLYRLSVVPLHLPPLRAREDDILVLASYFLSGLNKQKGAKKRLTPQAESRMRRYHWPGNVRQLHNMIKQSFIMEGDQIDMEQLENLLHAQGGALPRITEAAGQHDVSLRVGTSLSDAEKELIRTTLQHYDGNKKKAAQVLGVSLKTLYNRLKAYELQAK